MAEAIAYDEAFPCCSGWEGSQAVAEAIVYDEAFPDCSGWEGRRHVEGLFAEYN